MPADPVHGERCHLCGRPMPHGVCPVCDLRALDVDVRAPRWFRVTSSLHRHRGLLFAVGTATAAVVAFVAIDVRHWDAVNARLDRAAGARSATPPGQGASARAVARPLAVSVLAVNVPSSEWAPASGPPGFAFVVRRGPGWSDLLTDYHLVVDAYLGGDRSVYVSDGVHTYTGQVVAVSADPHVARIRVPAVFTVLAVSPTVPTYGDPVVVEPGGKLARASAMVVRYDGPGGASHLAFSAEVAGQMTGAPVLDRRHQVVGIAEPSAQFSAADGVGFAVPIAAACRAVRC